ncbi:MAG: hypothetical protein IPI67_22475 [Myxococcales bacterium]|nr:hypothetical protein [Myxococcales bacterium]
MSAKSSFFTGVAAGLALAVGIVAPSVAQASPTFPPELQADLDMPCAPPCTLCHRDSNGGVGTAVQPFGAAIKNAGLTLKSPEKLPKALARLEAESADSDGDGVTDVDELREGRNPNTPGEGLLCATYGCGARVVRDTPGRSDAEGQDVWFLLAFAAGAVAVRRRSGQGKVR